VALTADEVFIAGGGHVYVADVGATEPTDTTTAWDADWTELGYTTDAGVTITPSQTITDVPAWQSRYPVRRIVTAENFEVAFALLQWNQDTLSLALRGGDWVGDVYTPGAAGVVDERALGIEAIDGDKIARIIIPRGLVTDVGGININRTGGNPIPITFSALAEDDSDPFTVIADWASAS
jgi:hypothetical protein